MVKKNTNKNGKPSSAKKPKPVAKKKPRPAPPPPTTPEEEWVNPLLDPAIAGHWVAWNHDRTKIIAVADTFPEILAKTEAMGVLEPELDVAPGWHPKALHRKNMLGPDESPNVLDDIRPLVGDLERWLDTPHWWFGARKPRELLGTEDEEELRNWVYHVRYGIPT